MSGEAPGQAARTPGQAAYEARVRYDFGDNHDCLTWDELGADGQADWESAAAAAIRAARKRPAGERPLCDCGHPAVRHVENGCMEELCRCTEAFRDVGEPPAAAAQERPAPALSDAAVQAAAEVLFRDYESQYDASHLTWRDFTGDARKVLEAALASILAPAGERPAPELAAAMGVLLRVLEWFEVPANGGANRTAIITRAQLAGAYADGGLPVPEDLRKFLGKRRQP